mgnify:CR=1 FL=1
MSLLPQTRLLRRIMLLELIMMMTICVGCRRRRNRDRPEIVVVMDRNRGRVATHMAAAAAAQVMDVGFLCHEQIVESIGIRGVIMGMIHDAHVGVQMGVALLQAGDGPRAMGRRRRMLLLLLLLMMMMMHPGLRNVLLVMVIAGRECSLSAAQRVVRVVSVAGHHGVERGRGMRDIVMKGARVNHEEGVRV